MLTQIPGPGLLILCYHAVSSSWSSPLAVHPEQLRRQLGYLLRRGWHATTLAEAVAAPRRRTLVVTFDDAYRSVLDEGLPVLVELGVPASLFAPTDLVDEEGLMTDWIRIPPDWVGREEDMRAMSWDAVRTLAAAGWEIGSHTCSHPDLTLLPAAEARAELQRSREACEERLQRPCASFAYPFGFYDPSSMALVREAGYLQAVTLELRLLTPLHGRGLMDLPREGIYPTTNLPKFLVNSSVSVRRARFSGPFAGLARLFSRGAH
jgi:peptidoglycan/xylan/chitin deacetylase (PgdA/CDA1 family)